MAKVTIRPTSAGDLRAFYGEIPSTIRGLSVVEDGTVKGLVGLAYCGKSVQAFSDMKPEFRSNKKGIAIAIRAMMQLLKSVKFPVVALADEQYPGSAALLRKCGFEHMSDSPQGEVYVWRSQSHS
jgi:hypothetical protein